jgi:hypothetical protein
MVAIQNLCKSNFNVIALWSSGQFLATDPEVPGSIPSPTRFSEK